MNFNKRRLLIRLRSYFISGLLVWIPIWVTVIVLSFLVGILNQTILFIPVQYRLPGMGVLITLGVILLTGFLAANYLGKELVSLWDSFISRIPLVRTIHDSVKKILQTIITPEGQSFRKVLLVQFPHAGMWTVAFQTGEGTPEATKCLNNGKIVSVFVPTTPNITAGFLMLVPEKDVIELHISVEQALKFVVSLGVMQPGEKKPKILGE